MPALTFTCYSCGLRFTKIVSAGTTDTPCKACQNTARAALSAPAFKAEVVTSGPAPQNTGVSSVDHDIDVIIGKDSQLRLHEMQKRQSNKRRYMDAYETDGHHLSRAPDGSYWKMEEEQLKAARVARKVHSEALERINRVKKRRQS